MDGVAGRVGKREIESNGARVHLSFAVETRYFYRRERYQGAVRSRNDGRTILGVLENANDFSHPTVGVTVGDYSWYSRRLPSRRRHVIVMLRLSRANVAQNEHFRFERGDVGYSRAEVLGDAVLRGHFEQSVGREVVVTRRVGETERGVEIWVDRRGVRGRDVRETSDGDCRKMKQVPRDGYAKTKVNLRGEFAEQWYRYGCDEEARDGFRMLCEPAIVKQLKRVLDGLKRGAEAKKASSKL